MGAVPGAHARGGKGARAQTAPKPAENGRRASHGTARWLHDDCHHASELTYEISGLSPCIKTIPPRSAHLLYPSAFILHPSRTTRIGRIAPIMSCGFAPKPK